jgi:acyl-CoA dehydrogenase
MRQAGYLRLAVPEALGGLGATLRQACYAQAELARHCASTALAVNMHVYLTLVQRFGWKQGSAAAERVLRRVADEGIVLMTSGASDGIFPSGRAERIEGGYRVNARKAFCSQAPVANVLATVAVYDDPAEGPVVLAMGIPMSSPGVRVLETWDTLGMRATSSHEVELTDVEVTDAQISGRRPFGRIDPSLRNALVHFSPLVASVYFGIAARARDEAIRSVVGRKPGNGPAPAEDPIVQRQVGALDSKLRLAWWGLVGALNEIGDDYQPTDEAINLLQIAKRNIVTSAIEIVDLAMEIAGGGSYFKRSPLEQAYRDVRAGKYHPFTPEKALLFTGRLALEQPVDRIW